MRCGVDGERVIVEVVDDGQASWLVRTLLGSGTGS